MEHRLSLSSCLNELATTWCINICYEIITTAHPSGIQLSTELLLLNLEFLVQIVRKTWHFWDEILLQYKSHRPQQNRDHSTVTSMLESAQLEHKGLNTLLSCGKWSPFWIDPLVDIAINIAFLWVLKILPVGLNYYSVCWAIANKLLWYSQASPSIKRMCVSCAIGTHLAQFVSTWG